MRLQIYIAATQKRALVEGRFCQKFAVAGARRDTCVPGQPIDFIVGKTGGSVKHYQFATARCASVRDIKVTKDGMRVDGEAVSHDEAIAIAQKTILNVMRHPNEGESVPDFFFRTYGSPTDFGADHAFIARLIAWDSVKVLEPSP